jgi:hypothetical protein
MIKTESSYTSLNEEQLIKRDNLIEKSESE